MATPTPSPTELPLKDFGDANRRAQLDGVAAGTCAGFLSGFITSRLLKQSRNLGLLSGLVTGSVVGYLFTQESLKIQLAKARASHAQLRAHLSESDSPDAHLGLDGREKGFGGLEGLEDKYATTRGDH
ncbi:hypothetical protein DMC30DRAFT_414673 [Rhodotorula diobovata]|uniref:Uncharacterized protein n=1 Tax=Rhodotorula diobovata TaxID=5288 RepID=A0A5C5G3P3_9BASI|nr:hypothetical protein DMC30DRAFT_414673 [Rhodotorula diobovata]